MATTAAVLTPDQIRWRLSQLVEDFALATTQRSFDRTYNEVYVADEHMTSVLLAPVSLAAVLSDVAHALGVDAPWSVRVALGDTEPSTAPAA